MVTRGEASIKASKNVNVGLGKDSEQSTCSWWALFLLVFPWEGQPSLTTPRASLTKRAEKETREKDVNYRDQQIKKVNWVRVQHVEEARLGSEHRAHPSSWPALILHFDIFSLEATLCWRLKVLLDAQCEVMNPHSCVTKGQGRMWWDVSRPMALGWVSAPRRGVQSEIDKTICA